MGMKKNKLIFGWGVNDVDYNAIKKEKINGKWKSDYDSRHNNSYHHCGLFQI